jgi:hypothetical protein
MFRTLFSYRCQMAKELPQKDASLNLKSVILLSRQKDKYPEIEVGGLAQLVERLICIQKVRSSTLLASIMRGYSSVG